VLALLSDFFQRDPFFVYTLVAALFLGAVSLVTGWLRLDFMAVFQPKGLFHIAIAVIVAMVLSLLSQTPTLIASVATGEAFTLSTVAPSLLRGLSRLPLYVVALAYGPTAGLVAAGLFAAFATTSGTLGWAEAVLALELVVVGWFAIAPSPFKLRWAGPMNVVLAYFLTWATGGSAFLQHQTGQAMSLSTHWAYHQTLLWGVGLSVLLLFLVRPQLYQTLFGGSRIAPALPLVTLSEPPIKQTVQLRAELLERERQRQRGKLTEFPTDALTRLKRPGDKS
jgi:hypothetical protein